ncbi:MAG: MarR family transcriptional regulator [Firmicutes bacterium]|nr:MarR family transcriptional regulator [Candidatus Fiminaster equi]
MENKLKKIKINWFKLTSIYNSFSNRHLVNFFSLRVLNVIALFENECTQKKIVEMTGACKQSINNVIQDFIDKGYVTLVKNPKDKRYKLIKLTRSGKNLYDSTLGKVEKTELKVLEEFTSEEIETFLKFGEKYNDLLEKEAERI